MERNEYVKLAAVEDTMWYFRALHAHVERLLHTYLNQEHSARVLDAGCGTGGLIRRLAPRTLRWSWTGLDVSAVACDYARQRCGGVIYEASVESIPADAESFDAIVSADVLYHLNDDGRALHEFFRVLKPGGVVVINVPANAWLWSYHDEAVAGRRRYERKELHRKLLAAGLIPLWTTYWNTLLFPLIVLRRKLLPPPKNRRSDVGAVPKVLNDTLSALMLAERSWLRFVGALPFGTSLLVAARKPL